MFRVDYFDIQAFFAIYLGDFWFICFSSLGVFDLLFNLLCHLIISVSLHYNLSAVLVLHSDP